jgi:predicted aspartyl protease
MSVRIGAVATVLLAASLTTAHAEESCQLLRIAQVDMGTSPDGAATAPMSVGGQTFTMEIDTGGFISMLTDTSVASLGLPPQVINFDIEIRGYGGKRVTKYVIAHDIVFGGLKAARHEMLVLPSDMGSEQIGGIIAPDILRAYDDDFDFANAKFSLFSPKHCEGQVVYWTTGPYATIPITVDDSGHMVMPIEIDGKRVRATIDTGNYRTLMSLETAKSLFNISDSDPALVSLARESGEPGYRYPFKSMTFQDVQVSNPDVMLISDDVSRMREMPPVLLGMNVLRQLHIYIAYKERKIYATAASAH